MTLRVARPGLLTTVQDLGRRGHQHEGIPEGGAMDTLAARLANLLVGNEENAAVLEITLLGPRLEVGRGITMAVTGANFDVQLDGQAIPQWRAHHLNAGSTLDVGSARTGCRCYLAIAGGLDVPVVLGGRSTCLPAAFGGFHGRALRAGDVLASGSALPRHPAAGRALSPALRPSYGTAVRLIAAETPRSEVFDRLFDGEFRISRRSDRMGYRLEGEGSDWPALPEVLSTAVPMGTLQLPPGGSPILLMADRQTTGGYPVLGQVASIDLGSVAQLRPGDRMRFTPVSLDEAQRLYLDRERAVDALRRALLHTP